MFAEHGRYRRAAILVGSAMVLASLALNLGGQRTEARRLGAAAPVTLSVYTCCGSLSGFNDPNPRDLGSIHHMYGGMLAEKFPSVRWRETTFADPATLESRLIAAVAAGTPPDMAFVQGDYAGYTVLRNLALPLDQYYAAAAVKNAAFLPGMARWAHFGGHWWAIPAVSGPMGGQQLYLPEYLAPLGYNNQNLRTFSDFFQMSKKAVRFNAASVLTRIGYWPGTDSWETIGTLMCPIGHGLYNAADQPTATDPCNVAYLGYLKKLADLYGGYRGLQKFLAADPDFLGGNPSAYLATGKAILPQSGYAYWNAPPLDAFSFGVKGGLQYQLTPMPVTVNGTLAEAANYPTTQQEIIVPRGAKHPDLAFAVSKLMFWDHGNVLGWAASGSPVVKDQSTWLTQFFAGEAATRKQAGLPGNPIASLEAVKLQPKLGLLSKQSNPINPVDLYYQTTLAQATEQVLLGKQSPLAALQGVQKQVLAEEQRLKSQYGAWNW